MHTAVVQTSKNQGEVHVPILITVSAEMSTGSVLDSLRFIEGYRESRWCVLRVYGQTFNADIIKSFSPCLSTKNILLEFL
jgi:hypothetical protein